MKNEKTMEQDFIDSALQDAGLDPAEIVWPCNLSRRDMLIIETRFLMGHLARRTKQRLDIDHLLPVAPDYYDKPERTAYRMYFQKSFALNRITEKLADTNGNLKAVMKEALAEHTATKLEKSEKRANRLAQGNQHDAHTKVLAAKTAQDAADQIVSAYPELSTGQLHAGVLHLRGMTWDKIVAQCKVSKATASKYITRFYEVTGIPRRDRRMGMGGKKLRLDESRDGEEPSENTFDEHPEHR